MTDRIYYSYIPTPVGRFLLAGTEAFLSHTSFTTGHRQQRPEPDWREDAGPFTRFIDQFVAYFDGALTEFDIPLRPEGTLFQLQVWDILQTIPYGTTWSYGKIARQLGKPNASRAVGAANGANCLPIVIPCHRVIGSTGTLTGFGGGLEAKATLLKLEGIELHSADRQLRLV